MFRCFVTVSLLGLFPPPVFSDGILISWGPHELPGMTEGRFNDAKKRGTSALLKLNKELETWPEAYELLIGVMQHKSDEQLQAGLAKQITRTEEAEFELTSRLIVWERISSGDILFEGKGLQVDDDLFTMAGRANWCLRNMTGHNFGIVRPGSTESQLQQLRAGWQQFFDGDEIEDVPVRFPSKKTGVTEIRSPEAIHALITSLRPSERKSEYLKSTLKRLYNLDALPDDEESPAHLCNPDTYTHTYLELVTEIPGRHSSQWWDKWWKENKSNLVWDSEVAKFKIKK